MDICENYTKALKNLTREDSKRVIEDFDIDEYKSRCNNYSNVFYLMNLREDTHSEFIAWLFDCHEDNKDSFRSKFVKEFFESIDFDIDKEDIICVETQVSNDEGRPDIVIETKNSVIIIEVKLDARTSITKDENKIRRTQYERYKILAKKKYKEKKREYILIYSSKSRLKKEKNFYIETTLYKELEGIEIVKKLDYKTIEFSDIVLILYKILEKEKLYVTENTQKSNEITLKFMETFVKSLNNRENIYKINSFISSIKCHPESLIDKSFLMTHNYRRPKNCNIHIKQIIKDNNKILDIEQLLIHYIDYWQYNDLIINSYTKIVEIENKLFFIVDIYDKLNKRIKWPKPYKAPIKF